MKNEKMMREAPAWKLLLTMGLPVIVVMIVQVLCISWGRKSAGARKASHKQVKLAVEC